jgi:hypothetical protein
MVDAGQGSTSWRVLTASRWDRGSKGWRKAETVIGPAKSRQACAVELVRHVGGRAAYGNPTGSHIGMKG